jgi:phosphoglucosamine mutase
MGNLFGTDGIRGVANYYPIDAESAVMAGRAIAYHSRLINVDKNLIIIGQDTRLSGDMIAHAVGAGVCSAGLDVTFLGVIPTPAVAYLTAQCGSAAGVVISASHNPFADNGIKVFDTGGYKLSDQTELQIESLIQQGPAEISFKAAPDALGKIRLAQEPLEQYINFLRNAIPYLSLKNMTIVLDCANGATFQVAPDMFQRLGADVVPMFCSPDGININDRCGSQYPQAIAKAVLESHADLGLAFDGDGDRLIAVDEKGTVLTGDQVMAVCASDLKNKGKLRNNRVVSTVMSNLGFRQALAGMGIEWFSSSVGDRYVMEKMVAEDAVLGGEDSGHIIFRDCHTTGDGILAALHLLDSIQSAGQPLSKLSKIMTVFPQELINVPVNRKPPLDTIPEINAAIEQVENALGDSGRVLVRYSGTENKCRVMVEGPTKAQTEQYCRHIADIVKGALG